MGHEYELETHNGTRHVVQVADADHHSNWRDQAAFVGMLASAANLAEGAIKLYRYLRRR